MSSQTPLKGGITYTEDKQMASIITEIDDKGIIVLFNYIDDETSTVEASITDNFVETNHSVQDHIAIKPKIYRLRGCVGEIVYKSSNEFMKILTEKINSHPILQKTLNAMKPIATVSPVISNYTQAAINIVNQLEASYNRYKKLIEDNFIQSRQRQLTNKMQEETVATLNRILELRIPVNLKGLKYNKVLEKGDEFKKLYYLQSVSAHQGSNNYITDIEITIKEFRIATSKITNVDKNNMSSIQKASEINNGEAKTMNVNMSTWEDRPAYMSTWQDKPKNMSIWKDKPITPAYNSIKQQVNK